MGGSVAIRESVVSGDEVVLVKFMSFVLVSVKSSATSAASGKSPISE